MRWGALQVLFMDSTYLQYPRTMECDAQPMALSNALGERIYLRNSYINQPEKKNAYPGLMVSPKKSIYTVPLGW